MTGRAIAALESAEPGLPERLAIQDDPGIRIAYHPTPAGPHTDWEIRIDGFARKHERVAAVYQLVLVVPLPVAANGLPAFEPLRWGFPSQAENAPEAPAIVYNGEPLIYKRDVALEKSWLPILVGSQDGQLPDLGGTGYQWTLSDAILLYDPSVGPTLEGASRFQYRSAAGHPAPDPSDERFAVYPITWIPQLDHAIAPFLVRAKTQPPES